MIRQHNNTWPWHLIGIKIWRKQFPEWLSRVQDLEKRKWQNKFISFANDIILNSRGIAKNYIYLGDCTWGYEEDTTLQHRRRSGRRPHYRNWFRLWSPPISAWLSLFVHGDFWHATNKSGTDSIPFSERGWCCIVIPVYAQNRFVWLWVVVGGWWGLWPKCEGSSWLCNRDLAQSPNCGGGCHKHHVVIRLLGQVVQVQFSSAFLRLPAQIIIISKFFPFLHLHFPALIAGTSSTRVCLLGVHANSMPNRQMWRCMRMEREGRMRANTSALSQMDSV